MNAKTWYVGNILVIDDEVNPENNGKVFLFRFTNMLKPMIDKTNNPFLAIDRKKCKSEEDYNKKVAALREELEEENPKYLEWVDECGNVFDFFNGFDLKFTYSKTTINENGRQKTVNNYDDTKFIRKGKPVDKSEKKQEEIYDSLYDLDAYIKEMEYKSKEDLETLLDKCLNASYTTLKPTHKNEEETPKNARKEFQESKSNSSDDDDDLDFDKLMDEDDIPF
jgi:predicted nucleic-acid-binding Zn-ribbon protein